MVRGDGAEAEPGLASAALAPFAKSPDLIVIVDEQREIIARNPAAAAHAPDLTGPEARAALAEVIKTGRPTSFQWGKVDVGGVQSWYATGVTAVESGGAIVGALVCSRDVTELKRSEARYRRSEELLVDAQGVAHLGTWEWDITQPTATWSAELFRIYGLTPETYTPSYEAYLTKVHPDDRQRVIDATNRVFHEHVAYSHDERIYRPDGSIRFLHTWAFPVLDSAGTLIRLVGVCQDITNRKLAEDALLELNADLERRVAERTEKLEAALHELEGFNSMVSHDLRGPLAVIQMAAEVIERQQGLPDKALSMVGRIRKSVETMSTLLSDLLAFTRVNEGAVRPIDVDVTSTCTEILAELQRASPDRTVTVTIEPGLRLHTDGTLLHLVLANLLENAWKYSELAAAARIDVGAVERPEGRALFVRDNGIGFDMADVTRVFQPFTRLKSAAQFRGTGIGLATVQRIVQRLHGSIRVEAAVGQGATFFVVIPDAPAAADTPAAE